MIPSHERRRVRSDRRGGALDHLLAACRARGDVRALVLADATGLQVASAHAPDVDAEAVAAWAPVAATRAWASFSAHTIECRGERYHLVSLGDVPHDAPWLRDAVEGARRILG